LSIDISNIFSADKNIFSETKPRRKNLCSDRLRALKTPLRMTDVQLSGNLVIFASKFGYITLLFVDPAVRVSDAHCSMWILFGRPFVQELSTSWDGRPWPQ